MGKQRSVLVLLYSMVLILEATVLGNAFGYYTGVPQYVLFFVLILSISLVQKRSLNLVISRTYIFLVFITFGLVVSFIFFGATYLLRSLKIIALIWVIFSNINPHDILGRVLSSSLYLSNLGLILAIVFFSLPDGFSFTPDFVMNLRRYDEGFTGGFYWMKSFSGIFTVGDDPVPFLNGIPRYSGYYPEPGINAFYVMLGYAGFLYRKKKVGWLTNVLTLANIFMTFSVVGFGTCVVIFIYVLTRKFTPLMRLFLLSGVALPFLLALSWGVQKDIYFSKKFSGGSAQSSVSLWSDLVSFNMSGSKLFFEASEGGYFAVVPQILVITLIIFICLMLFIKFLLSIQGVKYDSGLLLCVLFPFLLKTGAILFAHTMVFVVVLAPAFKSSRSRVSLNEA